MPDVRRHLRSDPPPSRLSIGPEELAAALRGLAVEVAEAVVFLLEQRGIGVQVGGKRGRVVEGLVLPELDDRLVDVGAEDKKLELGGSEPLASRSSERDNVEALREKLRRTKQ